MKETKGEKIVKLLSKAFKGRCGDFGGKDPYVDGDEITLYSQIGSETYRFNDDGSVDNLTDFSDIIDNELAWDDYGIESEDEAREYFESISHFDSIEDLFNSGLSWFMDVPNSDKLLSDINVILKESLIEAEEDEIMSDDDLDAEEQRERDEMEARFKARRDKIAQQRADRDAKIARKNELLAKAEEIKGQIGDDWSFEHLFDILVPSSGKCDTLAGELIRAINKIEYRWFNDGDRWFEDYGIETCGQAAYFLMNYYDEETTENPLWDAVTISGENNYDGNYYDRWIEDMKLFVCEYIEKHPELLAMETKDMYEASSVKDVEEYLRDNNMIPEYEYDADLPDELMAHIEKGNIDDREVEWEVESWCENSGSYDCRVDCNGEYVYIEGLTKAAYDEFDGNLYRWLEQWAADLTNEYGDPYEEEEEEIEDSEEETDESLKEYAQLKDRKLNKIFVEGDKVKYVNNDGWTEGGERNIGETGVIVDRIYQGNLEIFTIKRDVPKEYKGYEDTTFLATKDNLEFVEESEEGEE